MPYKRIVTYIIILLKMYTPKYVGKTTNLNSVGTYNTHCILVMQVLGDNLLVGWRGSGEINTTVSRSDF